jgi:hypothetical protein
MVKLTGAVQKTAKISNKFGESTLYGSLEKNAQGKFGWFIRVGGFENFECFVIGGKIYPAASQLVNTNGNTFEIGDSPVNVADDLKGKIVDAVSEWNREEREKPLYL